MRSYRNPFVTRASEQLADTQSFLRTFGAGVLELLPESVWDRPLVIQSAPGGGKTSLMRLFTIESLGLIDRRRDEFPELFDALVACGALAETGPTHLGVLLNLDRDYRSLLDLGLEPERSGSLFFRLLDARILQAVVRATLAFAGATAPEQMELRPLAPRHEVDVLAEVFGGYGGGALIAWAQATEREVLRPLDSLLPVDLQLRETGATPLLSLRLLSATRIAVADNDLDMRPLVMFDDGHELGKSQRQSLLRRLSDRSLQVARWYSERFEALETDVLMVGSILGRDFELLELENEARRSRRSFEKVMRDVANRRARPYMHDYADVQQSFADLLEIEPDDLLHGREQAIVTELRRRVDELTRGHARYAQWVEAATSSSGYDRAVMLRALEIVVRKDMRWRQTELIEEPLDVAVFDAERGRIAQAARHFLARDFDLPYYAGADILAKLGSENMEQFLRLAGDMFEQMLAEITMRRIPPRLRAPQQDRIIRRASDRYWRELPSRTSNGRLVRRLVAAIVELCQADTFRPTAPYSPGVTGTAMLMSDRERLLDSEERLRIPGAEELYEALGSAVAHNVLSVELDYSVKNQRVMVIYLNRLICPRFKLPLGRGGFRERTLEAMAGWMIGESAVAEGEALEVSQPEQLTL